MSLFCAQMTFLKPDSPIEFLKGVGPQKAELLRNELNIRLVEDLLLYFPFRYIDKTKINEVKDLGKDGEWAYLRLRINSITEKGSPRHKTLLVNARDNTGG
ncbi:MAG: hypothetical protein ABIO44_02110, partial [Saprospiraceae bacterium]